jgi:hypothetical protein
MAVIDAERAELGQAALVYLVAEAITSGGNDSGLVA